MGDLSFHAPTIYSEELSNLRHGIPLWSPQPDHQSGNFELGDVGVILNGNFIKMFNAVEGPGHRNTSKDDRFPKDFKPLEFSHRLLKEESKYLSPGNHTFMHTDGRAFSANLQAGVTPGVSVGGAFSIDAQKVVGASLALTNNAESKIAASSEKFLKYVKQYHTSWYRLAKDEFGIACKAEDVVISRGWVKSTDWVVTSFKSSYRAASAGLQANAATVAGAGLTFSLANGHPCLQESKQGPGRDPFLTPDSPPCDQCVFLPVYKVRYRWLPILPREIKAGAGPHQLPDADDEGDAGGNMHVIADPEDRSDHGPLDIALEYMLSRFPDEENIMAVACEEDLDELLAGGPWPDDLAAYLRDHLPEVAYDAETRTVSISMERVVQGSRTRSILQAGAAQNPATHEGQEDILADNGDNVGEEGGGGGDGDGDGGEGGGEGEGAEEDEGEDDGLRRAQPLSEGQVQLGRRPPGSPPMKWPHVMMRDSSAEGSAVTSMAISPDGEHIATGMDDAVVRLWKYGTGSLERKLNDHEDTPWSLAFSPDGRYLASGGADYKIIIWDTQNEQNPHYHDFVGHESDVWSVAFSPDGHYLASGSTDSTVRIWDPINKIAIRSFPTHASSIMQIAWTPDSTRVVSCAEMEGKCWNVVQGEEISTFAGHTSAIWTMHVSPAGDRLITGSEDHTARIWNIDTGETLVIIQEHTGTIWSVAFSPDGREVVSGGYDKKVVVSDSFTGDAKHVWTKDDNNEDAIIDSVAFSRAGDLVVSGDAGGSVRLYDNRNGDFVAEYRAHEDKIKTVSFTQDDNDILSSSDDGSVRVWNVVDTLRI